MAIIAEHGVDKLSLRDVARRLGVSHGAPYKHFASRDHLLAEIVRRSFDDFAHALDARAQSDDADADMAAMGTAYIGYALAFPLQYRLMFSTALPSAVDHPEMMASAHHAFDLLRRALRRKHGPSAGADQIERDALFVWATIHGLAGILKSDVIDGLEFLEDAQSGALAHVLQRIGDALSK
jgi:AcrR family transcriptional regulator